MPLQRGRPRSFDEEAVLEAALRVFWKYGFQGASLSELTRATGLNKPSLYGAFGDKKSLYLKALQRYLDMLVERHGNELEAKTNGREAVRGYLMSMAGMLANPTLPGGCFIINGSADIGGVIVPGEVEEALRNAFRGSEAVLTRRLARAQEEGDLPGDADPERLAQLFFTVVAGLAVQAKSGAGEEKLREIIRTAMSAWPGGSSRGAHGSG